MGDNPADRDSDRAAILARRQRFIALAISGLVTACADDSGSPMPCLNVGPPIGTATDGTDGTDTDGGSATGPSDSDADSGASTNTSTDTSTGGSPDSTS